MRKRAIGEMVMSMGALIVLFGVLVSFDGRVREQVALRMSPGQPTAQIAQAGATVRAMSSVLVQAAREQSIEHAPMVTFVLAGAVLLLFMLRT